MQKVKASMVLGLGFIVSSLIVSYTFFATRLATGKYVQVKGLSERELDATVGIWTVQFEVLGNDINEVSVEIKNQTEILVSFLYENGFTAQNIVYGIPELEHLGRYRSESAFKYGSKMTVTVDTPNVLLLYETVQKSKDLIKKGVQLTRCWHGLKFLFTKLNDIKPSMIQEATLNAKKVADQIASDANVRLGALHNATQGGFTITDTHIPTKKQVRVVMHMTYGLQ
ncbi:MAG: SIMPL domain-containing protein [Amoebophilaceae bacterium]|nr:SIMPL domain-containing protein [Amoebophilaceae bacterium]